MGVDLRQVMAAFLTFSMFLMLGNMIKRDHIDPLLEAYPESANVKYSSLKVSKTGAIQVSDGMWRTRKERLQACWKNPPLITSSTSILILAEESRHGWISFDLSPQPQFHASQVANAVAVARNLGAKLAIPHIKLSKSLPKIAFGEIYDVDTFIRSLKGIVRVDINPPKVEPTIVRVPHGVSDDFIASKIHPIFGTKRNLKIVTYFNTSSSASAYECTAMLESLKLGRELRQVIDSMAGTLRSFNRRRRFVALDLRSGMCHASSKRCYEADEMGVFLRRIGVGAETSIYLTHTGWSTSFDGFRELFPNTFTKDAIMPMDKKARFVGYERIIDLYMCVESDVFVPSILGSFYSGVVGKRIGEGRRQIFIPGNNTSGGVTEYEPEYITNKTHFAYSCFC